MHTFSACKYRQKGDELTHHEHSVMERNDQSRIYGCLLPTLAWFCLQVIHAAGDEVLVTGGYDQCVSVWDCKSRSIEPVQTMRAFKVGAPSRAACIQLCSLVVLAKWYADHQSGRCWKAHKPTSHFIGLNFPQQMAPAAACC